MCLAGRAVSLMVTVVLFTAVVFAQAPAEKPRTERKQKKEQKQPPAEPGATAPASAEERKEEDRWKGLTWRLVGPHRGGRVLAVSGVPGDPATFYFGGVAGGIWKSSDGGTSWKPVADKEKITSIGDIAVAQSDPNVIYAGTGESCIRGNIVAGDGVYKSTDAGKSWKHIGLRDTRHIGRVIVHPKNPDTVFIAALGHAFGANPERGVFRSTDGGKTWDKVLYKDENTGAIDITFDPSNPSILYAALWQARRYPWTMESGGPGSGLYRSNDGGSTWKRLEGNGLPSGIMGRIGVAVSPNPNRVWALIEAEKGGLYRSDDGGEKWTLVNEDRRFRQRAWYYTHVYSDPKSPETVYILNVNAYRSTDGGKSFTDLRAPHGDHHALWIDPTNPQRMINGNDGGANVSVNGGASWTSQEQPTAQFYHVTTDNRWPYYVYGAQQDNTTVAIASRSDAGAITRADWYTVGGCESGYIAPDPRDANIVYAGCYGGLITRFDKRTGQEQEITIWPENPMGSGVGALKHRFQWTSPIVISPHDPNVLYQGGEVLFKTSDGGMSWTAISPDLTRNDKSKQVASGGPITKDNTSAEYYGTIFTIVESPQVKDTIWVGSDDGLAHITRDGGKNWTNITPKGVPEWGTVSLIEASPHNPGTAYVAVDRHRLDDFKPYVFKTTDYGKSWNKLTEGLPEGAFVRAVREDPTRKGLLYAGTERGVFVSWDDGAHWSGVIQTNLPVSPIHDLVVKNDDLVMATHGRSFWILDDLSPVRQFNQQLTQAAAHLFKPAAAIRTQAVGSEDVPRGAVGQNPPNGAIIYYHLQKSLKKEEAKPAEAAKPGEKPPAPPKAEPARTEGAPAEAVRPEAAAKVEPAPVEEKDKEEAEAKEQQPDITIEILDARGAVIRKYPPKQVPRDESEGAGREERKPKPLPADAGLNRFVWDLRYDNAPRVPGAVLWGGGVRGPLVTPGNYQVRLTAQGKSYTAPLEVKPDPRVKVSAQDFSKQFDLRIKVHQQLTRAHRAVNQVRDVRKQIKDLSRRLGDDARNKAVVDAGKELDKKMTAVEEEIIQTKSKAPQDPLNYPIKLNDKLAALGSTVESADSVPTRQAYEVFDSLNQRLNTQLTRWNEIVKGDLARFNELVKSQKVPAVIVTAEPKVSEEEQNK
ncbi:MAG: hypothetical protein L0Z53_02690 [Acidobacteriales bacterium]|nr:hypothetical protein [Terriglobales bacterium]